MNWTVLEENLIDKNNRKHAGGKAREDLFNILIECGFNSCTIQCPQKERIDAGMVRKAVFHFKIKKDWERIINMMNSTDSLVLQFPVINQTLLLSSVIKKAKKKGIKVYAIIHDLEYLRFSNTSNVSLKQRWRIKLEELNELKMFDAIVVHNESMKRRICSQLNIDDKKVITLNIFDYLIPKSYQPKSIETDYKSCIIAGNLLRDKAGYVYKLPTSPVFNLYGVNLEENDFSDNISYKGSYLPEELPNYLTGGFGLVWDGNSADTCSGVWGQYLKYNNPHKTSLYLACGIPVIIWEEAALADYIKKHQVGITVKSIFELGEVISKLSEDQYAIYKRNAIELSKELRSGANTKKALKRLGII